jgi:hypothetical protein
MTSVPRLAVLLALLLCAAPACGLVAGIDDREPASGTSGTSTAGAGAAGGATASGGAGGGGGDGGTGAGGAGGGGSTAQGGSAGCAWTLEPAPPQAEWADSSAACSDGGPPPCPNEGEDGNVVTLAASFQVDATAGVVTDLVTGLEWEHTTNNGVSNWGGAQSRCQQLGTDGGNWRLPSLVELASIADYGDAPLSGPPTFTSLGGGSGYWSASAAVQSVDGYWGLNMQDGSIAYAGTLFATNTNARCVRGTLAPQSLQQDGDVVLDQRTRLEWYTVPSAPIDWQGAMSHCACLPSDGGGWRLPTVRELLSIFEAGNQPNLHPLFGSDPGPYWSATPAFGRFGEAWRVDYDVDQPVLLEAAALTRPTVHFFRAWCVRFF